jgi:hypothetical protein
MQLLVQLNAPEMTEQGPLDGCNDWRLSLR